MKDQVQEQSNDLVIANIGAGFCGTTIAIHQMNRCIELASQGYAIPPITIQLIDQSGEFANGTAYGKKNGKCLLNQPTSEMSPFVEDELQNDFTKWLNNNASHMGHSKKPNEDGIVEDYTGDEFVERRLYGQYLEELLETKVQEIKALHLPVKVEKIQEKIVDLDYKKKNYTLYSQSGQSIHANSVVFAMGHQKSKFLNKFEESPRYFSGVCDTQNVESSLTATMKNEKNMRDVAIIGNGQSMMDNLMALKGSGYKGTIYAISRTQVEPWPYYPENYKDSLPKYKLKHFTLSKLKKCKDQSFECFQAILNDEIAHAKAKGYDVGHVVSTIKFHHYKAKKSDAAEIAKLKRIAYDLCVKTYGNPTCPEKYKVYQECLASGQLKLVRGEVLEDNVTEVKSGFNLKASKAGFSIKGEGKVDVLNVSYLFNGASFDRDPRNIELIKVALQKKIVAETNKNDLTSGRRHKQHAYLAGLLNTREKWGTGTFRKNNDEIGRSSIDNLIRNNTALVI